MLFLLNDVVFQLDGVVIEARLGGERLKGLTLPAIIRMGQELYAADPLLHRLHAARAQRLAALISGKAPMINAALFTAPAAGCDAHEVQVRFVAAQFEVMAELYNLQRAGELDALRADSKVWRRLAA
jgi:hypothetical protein